MLAQSTQLPFKMAGTRNTKAIESFKIEIFLVPEVLRLSSLEGPLCEPPQSNIGWPPYHLACDSQNPTLIGWLRCPSPLTTPGKQQSGLHVFFLGYQITTKYACEADKVDTFFDWGEAIFVLGVIEKTMGIMRFL